MVWPHFFGSNSVVFETVAVVLSARFDDSPGKLKKEEISRYMRKCSLYLGNYIYSFIKTSYIINFSFSIAL